MRALFAERGALEWREVEEPIAADGMAIVNVRAAAVNRADLMQAAGHYPPPPGESDILGLEVSGVEQASGRRVCALLGSGGFAERVAVPEALLMPIPDAMSFAAAAAVPEVWLTAHLNLFHEAQLRAGEHVLVHAAASGVGTAAVQLALAAGAKVIGTTRSAEKAARLRREFGVACVETASGSFAKEVTALSGGRGVDVVLDFLGAGGLGENLGCLNIGGRIVVLATLQGHNASLDLRALLRKRARLIGSTLRARPLEEKAALVRRFLDDTWPRFERGALAPVVDRVLPMGQVEAAFSALQANDTYGKVVCEW